MGQRQSANFTMRVTVILALTTLVLWALFAGGYSLILANRANKEQGALTGRALALVAQDHPQEAETLETQRRNAQSYTESAIALGLVVLIVTLLALVAIAIFYARHIGAPLAALVDWAARLQDGAFEKRIDPDFLGELGLLAGAFNQMAGQIQDLGKDNARLACEVESANEYQKQLIAQVSHQLRTPLGVILGLAEMLQYHAMGPLSAEQHDAVQKIIDHSRQLGKTYNQMVGESEYDIEQLMFLDLKAE